MNAPGTAWFEHPLAEPMLRFNLLPSLLLHPEQAERLLPTSLRELLEEDRDAISSTVLHRHWSAALRRQLNLEPVESLDERELPIAMLATDNFERLAQWCGIALLAPAIRRTIAREDVALLQSQLGEDGVRFARCEAASLQYQVDTPSALASDAASQARLLGSALLWTVFEDASHAVRTRARLRLPPDAGDAHDKLPGHLSQGPAALALARNILELLDPPWLSSFPTRH